MSIMDALSDRMKSFYEDPAKTKLIRRMPVIIRLDGKAFHTFTSNLNKPFDAIMTASMQHTAKYLCEHIQGCVLAYSQSDEISLLLIDYQHLDSCAWYDNDVMKLCSVSASMATLAFNMYFNKEALNALNNTSEIISSEYERGLTKALNLGALFDSRAFNIPKEEVANYFYWRQRDSIRNSIRAVGQAYYSPKDLQNKSNSDVIDMLLSKGVTWSSFPASNKYGFCITYGEDNRWKLDDNIPIFKAEGRKYVEKLIVPKDTPVEEGS